MNIHPKTDELAKLQKLLNVDPLEREDYTAEEKHILMICRYHYKSLSSAL
jgi:phosphatidylinositol-4,5-bisphosphate 3-kinase catalytic subunit alpha/beta/delta